MSSALSWRHHVVIQSLLSRGPLSEKDLQAMFEDLTKRNPGTERQLFDGFILKINKALSCANFELRACIDQYDGQVYYGVVNTVSDEHSKLGTKYSVPQIAFYKAIIEAIVQDASANGVISSIHALNLSLDGQVTIVTGPQSQGNQPNVPIALKNFSLSQKEKTLHELVRDQWLNLTTDGIIKLGLKSFLDLRSWFRNNDVSSCHVCNEAGIKAQLCQNENCTVRIHQYCLKQLFLQRKVAEVCPSCGTSWPYTVPKAEAVHTEDDNEPRESQRVTNSEREDDNEPRRSQRATNSEREDNNEPRRSQRATNSEREDNNEPRRSQRATNSEREDNNEPRRSQRVTNFERKRRRANRVVDDEVGCSNQDELNECRESQHGNGSARKRGRARRTDDADIGRSSVSQSSAVISNSRRLTRASARLT